MFEMEVKTMERIIRIENDMIKILNKFFCLFSALLVVFFWVFFFCMVDLSPVPILPCLNSFFQSICNSSLMDGSYADIKKPVLARVRFREVQNYFSESDVGLEGSLTGAFASDDELLLSLFSEGEFFSLWLLAGRLVEDDERWSVT